jgi:hypothetical protein
MRSVLDSWLLTPYRLSVVDLEQVGLAVRGSQAAVHGDVHSVEVRGVGACGEGDDGGDLG